MNSILTRDRYGDVYALVKILYCKFIVGDEIANALPPGEIRTLAHKTVQIKYNSCNSLLCKNYNVLSPF